MDKTTDKLTNDLLCGKEQDTKRSELGDESIFRNDSILSNPTTLESLQLKQQTVEQAKGRNPFKLMIVKGFIMIVGLALFFVLKKQKVMRGVNPDPYCMVDYPIVLYDNANDIINDPKNPFLRDFMMILSSFVIDIAFVTMCILWYFFYLIFRIKKGNSGRTLYMMGAFYGLRASVQGIFKFRFIKGFFWDFPNIPSLVVPYGATSDFYFSGHTGFMIMITLETWDYGVKTFSIMVVSFAIYVVQILLVYRVHYSIGKFFLIFRHCYRRSRCSLCCFNHKAG